MSVRSKKEIELWKKWKYSNFADESSFDELYKSLQPIVGSITQKWSGSGLPLSVIESEVKNLMIKALYDFNPDLGFQLNTFLINRLKKVSRLVYKYQNVGTIPEQRAIKIDTFKKIRTFLTDKLNREPTSVELSEELKWNIKEVGRMENELRASVSLTNELSSMSLVNSSKDQEILDFIYYELNPQEKLVYEYSVGCGGKPQLSGQEIAIKMNTSPSTVTRLKQAIEKKINKYRSLL